MTHEPVPDHDPIRRELAAIADTLTALSVRLDQTAAAADEGLVAMSVDTASQAVHLALVELQDCLVAA